MENSMEELFKNTKVDAHKGDSWRYPENSKQAIISSFQSDVDAVEFDVRMTKDKKIIIRHDDWMFTTSNSLGKISEMTLEELKKIKVTANKFCYFNNYHEVLQDIGSNHSSYQKILLNNLKKIRGDILTLEELLELAPKDKKLLLEVKENDEYYKSDSYSKGILELINNYQDKKIYVHGYDYKLMLWFKEHTNSPVGIGISDNIKLIDLPLDHACFNMSKIGNNLPYILSALEKRPSREFHFYKVDTSKELELYKNLLIEMKKYGLNSQTNIMTSNSEALKILIKESIIKSQV